MLNAHIGSEIRKSINQIKKFLSEKCPVNNGYVVLMTEKSFRKSCRIHLHKKNESCKNCKIKQCVLFNKNFIPPDGVKFINFEEIKSKKGK